MEPNWYYHHPETGVLFDLGHVIACYIEWVDETSHERLIPFTRSEPVATFQQECRYTSPQVNDRIPGGYGDASDFGWRICHSIRFFVRVYLASGRMIDIPATGKPDAEERAYEIQQMLMASGHSRYLIINTATTIHGPCIRAICPKESDPCAIEVHTEPTPGNYLTIELRLSGRTRAATIAEISEIFSKLGEIGLAGRQSRRREEDA